MPCPVADFRIERLVRRAPASALPLSEDDRAYVLRHLDAIGEEFGCETRPPVPLEALPGKALVRHLGELRARLVPDSLPRRLAVGRLESLLRLVETAIALAGCDGRRSA